MQSKSVRGRKEPIIPNLVLLAVLAFLIPIAVAVWVPDLGALPFWIVIVVLLFGVIHGFTWGPWLKARRTIGKEAWREYPLKRKISEYFAHSYALPYALRWVLFLAGSGIGGALAKWYFGG